MGEFGTRSWRTGRFTPNRVTLCLHAFPYIVNEINPLATLLSSGSFVYVAYLKEIQAPGCSVECNLRLKRNTPAPLTSGSMAHDISFNQIHHIFGNMGRKIRNPLQMA